MWITRSVHRLEFGKGCTKNARACGPDPIEPGLALLVRLGHIRACCLVLVRVIKGAGGGGTLVGAAMWALLTGQTVLDRENSTIGHVVSAVRSLSERREPTARTTRLDWTRVAWLYVLSAT